MMSEKNIYQRINAVMSECEYLQKKQAQQGKGIKYDEVMAMLRDLLIKNGIVMVVRQKSMEQIGGLEGKNQKIYQGEYEMDLINMDDPAQIVTHSAFAHGMDGGDKAPGKAQTYAVKIMLVKGFGIETGEDEESRSEKMERLNTITPEQAAQLMPYCLDHVDGSLVWTKTGQQLANAYRIARLEDLPASKFNEALGRCEQREAKKDKAA